MWRSAVMRTFDAQARALKICWAIEGLAAGKGYANPGNEFLSTQTGIPIKRLDETMTLLERAGVIIRTRSQTHRGRSRRIYLSVDIIAGNPPKPRGMDDDWQPPQVEGDATPHKLGENDPLNLGGTEANEGAGDEFGAFDECP